MGKYNVRELTSEDMKCILANCPAIYEVTPEDMRCALLSCPGIYEVTPEDMECSLVACPAVYGIEKKYFIIGERNDGKEFGLAGKIGKTEAGVLVDQRLIDEMER